jgi:hypothetical protein
MKIEGRVLMVLAAVASCILAGCTDQAEAQAKQRRKALEAALSNPSTAERELNLLLAKTIYSQDGMIVAKDLFGVSAMPSPKLITVDCSLMGLEAVFDNKEQEPKTVEVADVVLSDEVCASIAPLTARKIQTIISKR